MFDSNAPDEPGREILFPVATVIIGGLISSTLLDFLVTPGVFLLFGRKDAEQLAAETHSLDKAAEALAADFEKSPLQSSVRISPHKEEIAHG